VPPNNPINKTVITTNIQNNTPTVHTKTNNMTLTYSLNQDDYLTNQLYQASINKSVRDTRRKSVVFVVLLFLLIAGITYDKGNKPQSYLFIAITVLSLLFYPIYLKNHYKKHYKKYVIDSYKNRFGQTSVVNFNSNELSCSSENSESKFNLNLIEEIHEIDNYIFVKLNSSGNLIIKKSEIPNTSNLVAYLKDLAKQQNINYIEAFNWKWK
jgi:hypothetical protein